MLTPAGNRVVRVAPGAGFWIVLIALGLLATDALTRLRPGPWLRVAILACFLAVTLAALGSGFFDDLSIMREYAVNATRFAHEARRHLLLALGSLVAAVIVALPLGVLCHRQPRLRAAMLGALNVVQTIPSIALFGILMAPLAALAVAFPRWLRWASVASAPRPPPLPCSCTRCCPSSPTRWSVSAACRRRPSTQRAAWA